MFEFIFNNWVSILLLLTMIVTFQWLRGKINEMYDHINSKWANTCGKLSKLEKQLQYGSIVDIQDSMIKKYTPTPADDTSENIDVEDVSENAVDSLDLKVEKEFDDILASSDIDVNDNEYILN